MYSIYNASITFGDSNYHNLEVINYNNDRDIILKRTR